MSRAGGQEGCQPGAQWDILLNHCVQPSQSPIEQPEQKGHRLNLTPAVRLRWRHLSSQWHKRYYLVVTQSVHSRSRPRVQQRTEMVLSPVLCTAVVLATLGSILVLSVWCFLYRRHSGRSRASVSLTEVGGACGDEHDGQQELIQKAEPPVAQPPCPHLQSDPITSLQWRSGGQQREPAEHTCRENGGGVPPCDKVPEHRIPLPATELGDTALVTTKTVKAGE